jgi:hypothetical protein
MWRHTFISLLATLLCWSVASAGADKPVVVNHISDQRTKIDDLIHKHFGKLYEVVDVSDREHAYVPPKGIYGFGAPPAPVYVEGRCIRGNVLILHVITIEGLVASPYVARFTDPFLSKFAIERMSEKRFRTAQLDGKSVSSIAATRITFRCPAQSGVAVERLQSGTR